MYKTETITKRFDTDRQDHLDEYSDVVNDPTCTIVREHKEKISEKSFDEGKLSNVYERIVLVVTWQQKRFL
jgi:hypothetical protein